MLQREVTDLDLSETKAWLDRSFPLSISADFIHVDQDYLNLPLTAELLKITFSARSRMKQLRWSLPITILSSLIESTPGSFEHLESLTIIDGGWPDQTGLVSAFLSCPRLLKVDIVLPSPDLVQLFPIPWAQLTFLRLGLLSFNACRDVLSQCSNLVAAKLTVRNWDLSGGPSHLPLTVLPLLENLSMDFMFGPRLVLPRIGPLFASFSLPALKLLGLKLEWGRTEVVWDLSELLSRSPNIEEIAFHRCSLSTDVVALLRNSPTVVDLSFENCFLDPTLLDALEIHESHPPILPQLRHLNLEGSDEPDSSDSTFEDVIRSRWWADEKSVPVGVCPLSRVSGLRAVLKGRLHDCVDQGLLLD
ncbi:hypothetical protein DFH09DRAFT_1188472 [Mycena vulgaris]|nr:hypothetical protein DFH09DRAFT_1188472 [Mycena vulgaris]